LQRKGGDLFAADNGIRLQKVRKFMMSAIDALFKRYIAKSPGGWKLHASSIARLQRHEQLKRVPLRSVFEMQGQSKCKKQNCRDRSKFFQHHPSLTSWR
jgi:hypothetical protein